MRSRYSAFCVRNSDYLLRTLHPSRRQPDTQAELNRLFPQQRWVCLEILSTQRGNCGDNHGEVEFLAWYLAGADTELSVLHERSTFVRDRDAWLYLEGTTPAQPPRKQPNIGRNSPCWCGSGAKFKHCHGP